MSNRAPLKINTIGLEQLYLQLISILMITIHNGHNSCQENSFEIWQILSWQIIIVLQRDKAEDKKWDCTMVMDLQ